MRTYKKPAHRARLLSCTALALGISAGAAHAGDKKDPLVIEHGSVVISSSTYDATQGDVVALAIGSTLPDSATKTTKAISGNNYVTVWNNVTVDAAFGVTSPIDLTDIDAITGSVLHTIEVPPDSVATSFSSKSEMGLHLSTGQNGPRLVFVGYGGAGVGSIDVSNSDAVPGQDPTNPVTFAFGSHYTFPRTVDML
jgi:hypothetical protein